MPTSSETVGLIFIKGAQAPSSSSRAALAAGSSWRSRAAFNFAAASAVCELCASSAASAQLKPGHLRGAKRHEIVCGCTVPGIASGGLVAGRATPSSARMAALGVFDVNQVQAHDSFENGWSGFSWPEMNWSVMLIESRINPERGCVRWARC